MEDWPSIRRLAAEGVPKARIAKKLGVSRTTVLRAIASESPPRYERRPVEATSFTPFEELAEVKRLKAENRRLREDLAILRAPTPFFAGDSTPQPLMAAFIDQMRAEGHTVESICRVLREQGCQVAARSYRSWKGKTGAAVRTVTDALVMDKVGDLAWTRNQAGQRRMTPEGLYGRRKMTALLRRQASFGDASAGSVDRAMTALELSGVRRGKQIRTTIPGKDGTRAGDRLDRDFTAAGPDHTWVMDFSYVRTWAGFSYVAFIVDVYSQRIVAWHAQTTMHTELVLTPLRMAVWQRDRDGRPILPGSLRMECLNGLYKTECIRTTIFHPGPFKTIADVEYATAGGVDWCNNRRLHSSLGYVAPVEYETAHYAALIREAQLV